MTDSKENKLTNSENTVIEKENRSTRINKVLVTVFSVVGSLLLGLGITVLLVAMWERFPVTGRVIISFLPMLLGQIGAIFTYIKKRDKVVWCEGAAMLWSIGVTATVGMFSSLFGLHLGALNCLLIDALLVLPIIFFFNASTPLAFYHAASIAGSMGLYESLNSNIPAVCAIILTLIPGIIFTIKNSKGGNETRFECCKWISVIAAVASAICCGIVMESQSILFMITGATLVCLYALSKEDSWSSPFYLLGAGGTAALSVTTTCMALFEDWWESCEKLLIPENFIGVGICVALFAIGFIKGEKTFENNFNKTAFCGAGALSVVFAGLLSVFSKNNEPPVVLALCLFAVTLIQAVTLIVKGAQERKYFALNIGLIMIIVLMFGSLTMFDMDLLVMGIMLIISGLILFVANYAITRSIKKEQDNKKVVQNNE